MPHEAQSVLASKVEIEISSSYVEIPGCQNIEVAGEDNVSFETGTITGDTNTKKGSGVADTGGCTFSIFFDPSDTTHQHLEDTHNAGGPDVNVNIRVTLSETGETKTVKSNFKKFDLKGEKKSGWMADLEFEALDRWTIARV